MGISNRFVHCIIGTTGGSATRAMLDRLGPGVGWLEKSAHWPLRYYREHFDIKPPAIGHVRNPFDWYIAMYVLDLRFHFWRGSFEDWFHNVYYDWAAPGVRAPTRGAWMWDQLLYFGEAELGGGIAYDYVLRFENLQEDLIYTLGQLVSDLMTEGQLRTEWPGVIAVGYRRLFQEGIEQWMRSTMYTPQMIEEILKKDAPIFERFGYTFDQKYYFSGGGSGSYHGPGMTVGNWEQEKQLSEHWFKFEGVPGPW